MSPERLQALIEPLYAPPHTALQRFKETLKKPIIIYGAGYRGRLIASLCKEFQIPIAAVCDKNLAGSVVPGLGVVQTFLDAIHAVTEYQVVIASVPYRAEIEQYVKSVVPTCETYCFQFPPMIEVGNVGPADYRRFLREHLSELEVLSERLSDELSRETLYAMIKARLTWDYGCLKDVQVDDQYFLPDVVPMGNQEVFYDCGAWIGDSLSALKQHTHGNFRKAFCFEPGKDAGETLCREFQPEIQTGKVVLIPKAVSDRETTLYFRPQASGSHLQDAENAGSDSERVETTTIDRIAESEPDATYIKMDIEGAELDALKGAMRTIQNCRPKLAICVYHKVKDLVEIPQYIDSLSVGYHYFLRHHSDNLCETVFYAIPNEKVMRQE